MKRKFRNIALAFATTTLGVATLGLVGMQTVSATGDVTPDITNDDYRAANFFVDGYSVRIPSGENDEHGYGVRFYVRMSQELYAALPDGATTGTLFLPESLIGDDNALTLDDASAWDCPTTDQWYAVTDNNASYMESVVYCYDIPEENYGSDIAVVGYVKVGEDVYYSASSEARSMSWVAKNEYNNAESKLDSDQKAELKAEYLDCTITLDGEEYATVMYGEKITAPNTNDKSNYYYYNVVYTGAYSADGTKKWDFDNDTVVGDVNLTTFSEKMYEGELENFSTFDSKVNAKSKANLAGQDAQWHEYITDDNGETRYGVASTLNVSGDGYKHYHVSTSMTESVRGGLEANMGGKFDGGGAYWYYESIWTLVDVEGEVTLSFGKNEQTIQGGVWTEVKLYESYLEARSSGLAKNWAKHGLISDSTSEHYTFMIDDGVGGRYADDVRVYFDSVSLQNGVAITTSAADDSFVVGSEITVTGDYNGNGETVNANTSYFQSVTYTYAVKDPSGNDVAVSADGKFTPSVSGEYEVTVTATAVHATTTNTVMMTKGQTKTVTDTIKVKVAQAPNVLNAFDTEEDTTYCGWKGIDSNGVYENEKQWLASYENHTGVLQLSGWDNTKYRNYFVEADSRWTQASLQTYMSDTNNWDYVSVVLWIDAEGEITVQTPDETHKVQGQTWVELKLTEEALTTVNATKDRCSSVETFTKYLTNSNDYLFYITTADNTDATNITVYIDSVSLEKNA